MTDLRYALGRYSFSISAVLIAGCFIISRLPLFTYFPIPGGFVSDAFEYFKVALEIKNGEVPLFEFRTPGYPFFIYVIDLLGGSTFTIIVVQNLFSLFAALFFVYAVNRTYKGFTYAACFSLIFFLMGNNSIEADSNVLTNSLYANCLIIFLGLLLFALNKNKFWTLLSVLTGVVIYIRPSGLFILPIIALIAIFLFRIKHYSSILKLTVPLVLMLLGLSFYNYKTLHAFAISPFGGLALAGTATTFMDTSSNFTECENRAVVILKNTISAEDREIVKTSREIEKLHHVFFNNHYHVLTLYKDLVRECGYSNFIEALPSVKKLVFDAIKKHPDYYRKFVLTSFYNYVIKGNLEEHQLFYYSEVQRRYQNIYIKKKPVHNQFFSTYVPDLIPEDLKRFTYKEYYDPVDPVGLQAREAALKSSLSFKLFDLYTLHFNRVVLRNWFWPIALIVLFFYSGFSLLLGGLKNKEALLIFVICCLNFCSAIVVSLVEPSFYHYTYMTEFTYYLAVAFSPLLFRKWIAF